MPCAVKGHVHKWPSKGCITIEKCERYCYFCEGEDAKHEWKFPWFLRRHVNAVHCKPSGDKPHVTVSKGWAEKPGGIPKAHGLGKRRKPHAITAALAKASTDKPTRPRKKRTLVKRGKRTKTPVISSDEDEEEFQNDSDGAIERDDEWEESMEIDSQDGDSSAEEELPATVGALALMPTDYHAPFDMASAMKRLPAHLASSPRVCGDSDRDAKYLNVLENFHQAVKDLSAQGKDGGLCGFDIVEAFSVVSDTVLKNDYFVDPAGIMRGD